MGTRLQPKKDTPSNPILSSSQSAENHFIDKNHKIQNQKPPLLGQRSAPTLLNKEKTTSTQTITDNNESSTNINNNTTNTNQSNQNQSPSQPQPPTATSLLNVNTTLNGLTQPLPSSNSLIAATNGNATHVAFYFDETGNLRETPLNLPDMLPAPLPVLGPLGAVSSPNTENN